MNNIKDGSVLSSSWVPFGYTLTIVCLTTYLATFAYVWWLGVIKVGGKGLREYLKDSTDEKKPGNGPEHEKTNVASTGNREQVGEQVRDSQLV